MAEIRSCQRKKNEEHHESKEEEELNPFYHREFEGGEDPKTPTLEEIEWATHDPIFNKLFD